MDEIEAEDVLESLAGRSLIELIQDGEGQPRSQAHDLLRDFLLAEAREVKGEEGVRQMHRAIAMQGIQACEHAEFKRGKMELRPYFGSEGLAWHIHEIGEGTVGQQTADVGMRRELIDNLACCRPTLSFSLMLCYSREPIQHS
jgi:hypothetical protein